MVYKKTSAACPDNMLIRSRKPVSLSSHACSTRSTRFKMRSSLLCSLLGASLLAGAQPSAKPGNNVQRRVVDLKSLRLNTNSQYINHKASKADQSLKLLKPGSYVETATELVKKVTPNAEFRLTKDHYIGTNGVAHVYFRQMVNGLDVGNANFNVNVSIWIRSCLGSYGLIHIDRP